MYSNICTENFSILDKEFDRLQFGLKMDFIMTSLKRLTPIVDTNAYNELELPSIFPLHPTIGLSTTNTYKTEDMYRKFNFDVIHET